MRLALAEAQVATDIRETHVSTARAAGLTYVTDSEGGITRKRVGTGWAYYQPDGALIRDRAERRRIGA
ncbi:MAG: hypothetical protein HY560_05810, partial [Gemmatimonadetes bacterium]|nr:hypothetical protein [Gemmatimonadota bacterium]